MKIGIFSDALSNRFTGIGNYTFQIIRALEKISDKNNIFLINSRKDPGCDLEQIVIPNPFPVFRTFSWYPYAMNKLNRHEFDIIHNPSQVATFIRSKNRYVVTIHDLSPKICPADHAISTRLDFNLLLPRTCQFATKIIADSVSTKEDLVRYFSIDPDLIKVIYLAADPNYCVLPVHEMNVLRESGTLPEKFILFVGTLEPRKNIPALLIAYHELLKSGFTHTLVIVGKKGWKYRKIFDLMDKLKLSGKVIFLENLSVQRLCELYNMADLFVYPSYYEGFGLPPLEAMTCGCPVITSNISSLPEVVGQAGITVNPENIEGLANQVKNVLSNEDLRSEMRAKGISRARIFSWDTCVRETLKTYEESASE